LTLLDIIIIIIILSSFFQSRYDMTLIDTEAVLEI